MKFRIATGCLALLAGFFLCLEEPAASFAEAGKGTGKGGAQNGQMQGQRGIASGLGNAGGGIRVGIIRVTNDLAALGLNGQQIERILAEVLQGAQSGGHGKGKGGGQANGNGKGKGGGQANGGGKGKGGGQAKGGGQQQGKPLFRCVQDGKGGNMQGGKGGNMQGGKGGNMQGGNPAGRVGGGLLAGGARNMQARGNMGREMLPAPRLQPGGNILPRKK